MPGARGPSPRRLSARTAPGIGNGVGEWGSSRSSARARSPSSSGSLPHGAPLTSIAFSPDGSLVATGGTDGTVRIWDLVLRAKATGFAAVRPVLRHDQRVRSVEFSPDGRLLLTASDDRTVRVWDVASGVQLRRFEHPAGGQVGALQPRRPADRHLTLLHRDPFARVFDVATGAVAALEHPGAVTDARFTPDNSRVVSLGRRNIFVWQRGTWRRLHLLVAHVSPVHGVSVSPDSTRAVSFDDSGIGRMWRLDTGERPSRATSATRTDDSVLFSPDSSTVLTASADLTARILDRDFERVPNVARRSPRSGLERHVEPWTACGS